MKYMIVFFIILRVILKDKCKSLEICCFLCLKMWSKDLFVGKKKKIFLKVYKV